MDPDNLRFGIARGPPHGCDSELAERLACECREEHRTPPRDRGDPQGGGDGGCRWRRPATARAELAGGAFPPQPRRGQLPGGAVLTKAEGDAR
eukprot:2626571-Lingulodinium_polyedra.AAC.1